MPATVQKRKSKWRVIEKNTGKLVRNKTGTVVDSGGHATRDKALRQARAINSSMARRRR